MVTRRLGSRKFPMRLALQVHLAIAFSRIGTRQLTLQLDSAATVPLTGGSWLTRLSSWH